MKYFIYYEMGNNLKSGQMAIDISKWRECFEFDHHFGDENQFLKYMAGYISIVL